MRPATEADLPRLVELTNLAYQVEAFCIEGPRLSEEEARGLMTGGTFLLAEDAQGRLRGSVFLREDGDRRCYLGLLAVDPGLRGLGLGRALVAAAEDRARAAGGRFMDLTVLTTRPELFAFYGRLGDAANEVRPYRDPERLKVPCRLVRFSKALVPLEEL